MVLNFLLRFPFAVSFTTGFCLIWIMPRDYFDIISERFNDRLVDEDIDYSAQKFNDYYEKIKKQKETETPKNSLKTDPEWLEFKENYISVLDQYEEKDTLWHSMQREKKSAKNFSTEWIEYEAAKREIKKEDK